MKISIITPVCRGFQSIALPFLSLKTQTFKDYECIIVDKQYGKRGNLINHFNDILGGKIVYLPEKQREGGYFWGVCNAMNTGWMVAKGDLIVVVQDYTWFPSDGLERFWNLFIEHKNWLVSGISHKIKENEIWRDPRAGKGLYSCPFIEFEMNYCSIPLKTLRQIGGWDEEFDKGWHYENQDLALRAKSAGYELWVDGLNTSYHYDHKPPEALFKNGKIDYGYWKQVDKRNRALIQKKVGLLR